jgi:hypothetical protein
MTEKDISTMLAGKIDAEVDKLYAGTYTTRQTPVSSNLTIDNLLASVRKFEETLPTPFYSGVVGSPDGLARAMSDPVWKLIKSNEPRASFTKYVMGMRLDVCESLPSNLLVFQGKVRGKEYLGIYNLDTGEMSESTFNEQSLWGK